MKRGKQNKGFTLLEILLVIAAIGILAAIVLIAINPNRQLAQARDTKRKVDVNTIHKALEQYLIDTRAYPAGIATIPQEICDTGAEQVGGPTVCTGKLDLKVLVPNYLAAIPKDPGQGFYRVYLNLVNNKISVSASGELSQKIVINSGIWTPVRLGSNLALWLDGSDSNSITLNGATISQWNDKSGNSKNPIQGTVANQPTYTISGLNGRSVVTFDGINDQLTITNFIMGESAVSVAQRTATNQPLLSASTTSYRGFWGDAYSGFTTHLNYGVNGATPSASAPLTAITIPAIVSQTGSQIPASYNWFVGFGDPSYSYLNGFIAEIIISRNALSTVERQVIEGYLAWKWGLVDRLPLSHPYKYDGTQF